MAEHIQVRRSGDLLQLSMDRSGYELFQKLLTRTQPARGDNRKNFKEAQDRVAGAFMAGAHQMDWGIKWL